MTRAYQETTQLTNGIFVAEAADTIGRRTRLTYQEYNHDPIPSEPIYGQGTEIIASLPIRSLQETPNMLAEQIRQHLASGMEERSLGDLGLPEAESEAVTDELLSAAGLEEAA